MRFDKLPIAIERFNDSDVDNEKLKEFCKKINAKSISYGDCDILESDLFFSRLVEKNGRTPTIRGYELDSDNVSLYKYQSLLDHRFYFKTEENFIMVVTFPYLSVSKATDIFVQMQREHPITNNIDIIYADDKYKFRKGGSICIFTDWKWHRKYLSKDFPYFYGNKRIMLPGMDGIHWVEEVPND